ncbi:hypothetical protein [Paenibacillus mesotrionivorans]|jgi:DNA-directed RNA polymerase subunit RPC12/RpoP|uniref:Uncharacterized protein n=1 Tax=Paenibacillus mesotrionivorans TaxID=3160968 RepID=A0ACC7P875_9BACL
MSDHTKSLVYRCPLCLHAGNDVTLRQEQGDYRCLRCSFTGSREDILDLYEDYRKRYKLMGSRVTLEMQQKM